MRCITCEAEVPMHICNPPFMSMSENRER